VQLQLLTAVVKLFLKRPKDTQEMVQTVLNLATQESDNPDLRDRGFIYWRLLSTDPEAAKAVVLSEKPLITDTTSQLDENLLNELIPHISTLASVYHKPPESFVTKLKGLSKGGSRLRVKEDEEEEGDYDENEETEGNPVSPSLTQANPSPSSSSGGAKAGNLLDFDLGDLGGALPSNPPSGLGAPAASNQGGLGLFDLGGPSGGGGNAFGGVRAPAAQKALVLPADQGKGMQISAAFSRREGRLGLEVSISNFTPNPMGNFVIQFDKNTFGLAPAGTQIPINTLSQGQSGEASVAIAPTGIIGNTPPNPSIRMAIRNSQSNDVFFFQMVVPFHLLFTESGSLERSAYLSMWKSISDSNEKTKDLALNVNEPLDSLLAKLTARNMFEIARRKVLDQDVVYLSVKTENSVYILVELTFKYGMRQCKCSSKTSQLEYVPFFEQALETILNSPA